MTQRTARKQLQAQTVCTHSCQVHTIQICFEAEQVRLNSKAAPAKVAIRDAEAIATKLDDIQEQVRAMIDNGTLRPGERVNEQALALQLGVGRNSAREALRSLERMGLVRIVPNRGAEVRKVSLEDALDLYDVRAGIAHTAGRLAAMRLEPAEEAELQQLVDQMESALHQRDGGSYSNLNQVFHDRLMAATKNPRLGNLDKLVAAELSLHIRKGVYTIAQMHMSHAEHKQMLEALRNGNVAAAATAYEKHILNGKQRMLDTVRTSASRADATRRAAVRD
jgi:DNA-binding GntR family transcriptional regulator